MTESERHHSCSKGNSPEAWDRLLSVLDEKLQLGLLDRLKRVRSYHLEGKELFIECAIAEDYTYLTKPAVAQQLTLFVTDAFDVDSLKVQPPCQEQE